MNVFTVAHAFRASLEALKAQGKLPPHMLNFPQACCGVVSELLGDYLNTQLGLMVEYVGGDRDGASHAWLELNGVVIDITGDQFHGRPAVFIASRDEWYASWEESSRHFAIHEPKAWTYREERSVLRALLFKAGLTDT
ncbi:MULTISPECIES: hypothetical protein [Pseudomonas]|uniref:hypothetical protein n=1 Tax=Pseudomonas TaxID=286 RepID=UPI001F36D16D|nr:MULTISPECIES: hypothetical protein [Pseudomonas]MCF5226031.1 hypothetical protein [Pseudomonas syringae]MCF5243205.1 hypothetical protein [Pseudomonas syringae]